MRQTQRSQENESSIMLFKSAFNDAPLREPDPEGGAHGCAPFFDRARMASRKIPIAVPAWGCFVGEGPFLWFVSFGPAKEMNSAATADETLLGFRAKRALL